MSTETRDTLLHGQLQEGLRYEIMESSTVSGATQYSELCLTARNEEKRQQLNAASSTSRLVRLHFKTLLHPTLQGQILAPLSLWILHVLRLRRAPLPAAIIAISLATSPEIAGHLTVGAPAGDRGSSFARPNVGGLGRHPYGSTRQVKTPIQFESLQAAMYSSDEDTDVKGVQVLDRGSHPQGAWVDVQGVPRLWHAGQWGRHLNYGG